MNYSNPWASGGHSDHFSILHRCKCVHLRPLLFHVYLYYNHHLGRDAYNFYCPRMFSLASFQWFPFSPTAVWVLCFFVLFILPVLISMLVLFITVLFTFCMQISEISMPLNWFILLHISGMIGCTHSISTSAKNTQIYLKEQGSKPLCWYVQNSIHGSESAILETTKYS